MRGRGQVTRWEGLGNKGPGKKVGGVCHHSLHCDCTWKMEFGGVRDCHFSQVNSFTMDN